MVRHAKSKVRRCADPAKPAPAEDRIKLEALAVNPSDIYPTSVLSLNE
jgi:hypothetical protein